MIDLLDIPARVVSRPLEEPMVTLRELLGGQPMHVTLLRHADCSFCQMHVSRLLQRRNEIGRSVLVSFDVDGQQRLDETYAGLPHEWLLLTDGSRSLYTALGARRTSTTRVTLDPRVVPGMVRAALTGGQLPRKGVDIRQLGADVVVDATGDVRWTHLSSGPEDRPSVDRIIAAMRDAEASGLRAA